MRGCENTTALLLPPTQGSEGRWSWMKPTASGLHGSVNEAERRPELRKNSWKMMQEAEERVRR